MKQVVTGWDHLFGPWLMEKAGGSWQAGRGSTIGLFDPDRGIEAAVLFTDCNDASVVLHCAGEGKKWLNREFLWFVFYYPFEQLGVTKIISPVDSSNVESIRFIEHIGFIREATLREACPKGNDLILYTMTRDQCKWLKLGAKYRGQTESAESS